MSDRDFRLVKTIRPSRYDIHIRVDLEGWRFDGRETIAVELAEKTDTVTLHAVDLEIHTARLHDAAGEVEARVTYNRVAETATLHFSRTLTPGSARLEIAFGGEILARLRGFYRSQKDGARYAATQFEAADARRALPCFDEPEFKARFRLTLDVPAPLTAIANGAIVEERPGASGRKEVVFAETPPISSYLLAYTVGPYEPTPTSHTASRVPVRVFLPKGMVEKGIYARDAHVRSLEYLEDYTALPYPYGKVDAIGVPDFEAGAMENPGAITYRLTAIAADSERASTPAKKGIFYTAAHELTHMWWGDLVTMAWWDDLWLNESFATFIGYKTVADLLPEWGLWRDFVATLTRPFVLDSLESTHPISFEVKNAQQATERFDVITYWKGAGVVRMIEGFLGAEIFQSGVRTYLNRYRESNATADDFWRELSDASGTDVASIANAWIKQPGHPLVSITSHRDKEGLELRLEQRRFFADPKRTAAAAEKWPIPMVIKFGGAATGEERVVVPPGGTTLRLAAADWFYANGADASGFYRVALQDGDLAALVANVQTALSPAERLDMVGNQWALAKSGAIPLAQFFAMLEGFREERDRAVLAAICERLSWTNTHLVDDTTRPSFEKFMSDFLTPHYREVGWGGGAAESDDDRLRRATVLAAMGELAASTEVCAEARQRLDAYLQDPAGLDPNLASVVVHLAAHEGDAELYDRYRTQKRRSSDDPEGEQRFLFGLTAFTDARFAQRTLDLSLTDEVRPQDRAHLLARILGDRRARQMAWEFVRARWEELVGGMDPMLQQNVIRGLAQLTPEPTATQVRSFLGERIDDGTRETIAQATEQLGIDAAVCQRLTPSVGEALRRA